MAMTRQGAPNGWLLHIEGAISGLFFGGGRLPQLLINFMASATLQIVALGSSFASDTIRLPVQVKQVEGSKTIYIRSPFGLHY
jgi:hypothetical protein